MKTFLIDPYTQTITQTTYSGNWRSIAPMIGCDYFTCITINDDSDTLYVDDEGLLKDQAEMKYFRLKMSPDFNQTYAGKGMVLGSDPYTGDSTDAICTLEWLQSVVSFPENPKVPEPFFSVMSL